MTSKKKIVAAGLLAFIAVLFAAGYGMWWNLTRDARRRDNADAAISMFKDNGLCGVGKPGQQSQDILCNEVGNYLSERMKLKPGSTVILGMSLKSKKNIKDLVLRELSSRGYVVVDTMVAFITEPEPVAHSSSSRDHYPN